MNKALKKILLTPMNVFYRLDPTNALKLMFYLKQGHKLDLENPKTYNEKINWLKLNYKDDLIPKCADKYTVREYVENCGCGEILTTLLWDGFNPNNIPFNNLPDSFVIKVTHGSGLNIICKNKKELNTEKVVQVLQKWLRQKHFPCYGEWFYGVVKPRIIVEEFLSEGNQEIPVDYKMFCFNNINGKLGVGLTVVDTDRFTHHKRRVYDSNWNLLPDVSITFPYDPDRQFPKPAVYDKMVQYAKKLAEPFPHARVDFYVINDRVYFGEITFTSDAGFGRIKPHSMNEKMGSWIRLPNGHTG